MTISGVRRPDLPLYPWRSEPQMPVKATPIKTSSGDGVGKGRYSI